MSLLPCLLCGRTDPRRMIGLMAIWFSRYLEAPPDGGYFYLCPACYADVVLPRLDEDKRQAGPRLPRGPDTPPTRGPLPPLSA